MKSHNNKEVNIGDEVYIEQAWEDEAGYCYDTYAVVSKILPDGRLKFQCGGHWKTRKQKDQLMQAWLNKQEIYIKDVIKF